MTIKIIGLHVFIFHLSLTLLFYSLVSFVHDVNVSSRTSHNRTPYSVIRTFVLVRKDSGLLSMVVWANCDGAAVCSVQPCDEVTEGRKRCRTDIS